MKNTVILIAVLLFSTNFMFADIVIKTKWGYPLYQDGGCGTDMEEACFTYEEDYPSPFPEGYEEWTIGVLNTGDRFNFFEPSGKGPLDEYSIGTGYIDAILDEPWIPTSHSRPDFDTDELTQVYTTYGDWMDNLPDTGGVE